MMLPSISRLATVALASSGVASAVYSIASEAEIKETAKQLAADLMAYYHGNEPGEIPGILPGPPDDGKGPYYWWEGGALWGTMIDYWHLTGDTTYNEIVKQAMLFQVGEMRDYEPRNYTVSLGNDDQGFWGMSAMLAAENNFENPPPDQPQWLALAQAVFNRQASPDRHDNTCNGGLRWQIPTTNNGYNYKNSIANGCFFNLGARLARYTNNETYAMWAEKTWDWVTGVGLIDADYHIYDGAHVEQNCTDINKAQFSYNNGVYLLGAAYMYNYTNGSAVWEQRTRALLNSTFNDFFPNNTAYEIACETGMTCSTDMYSFKGYVHRWLSTATRVAPFIHDQVMTVLRTSTEAAVRQCTGGASGRECGFYWTSGVYKGPSGAGQQMNVLGAVSSLLIDSSVPPVSNMTGGTSIGDSNAGSGYGDVTQTFKPLTTGDKAGAGILTFLVLGLAVGTFGWMSLGT